MFKILIFWVVSGLKMQKMGQNEKKKLSVVLSISGSMHHKGLDFWYTHVTWWHLQVLF